jgi:hypothetical protein
MIFYKKCHLKALFDANMAPTFSLQTQEVACKKYKNPHTIHHSHPITIPSSGPNRSADRPRNHACV